MLSTPRADKIESYGAAHRELAAALAGFPRESWSHRAPFDPWTVHERTFQVINSCAYPLC